MRGVADAVNAPGGPGRSMLALNQNLDLAKASQVPRWRESEAFTRLERDVLEYAEAMTNTPTTVTDELSARLLDRLGGRGCR